MNNKKTFLVVYNEGQGFTEIKKYYNTIQQAITKEGKFIINAKIYKKQKQVF